jgi:Holliday junction resolvase RusA-like endonuclease
MKIFIQYDPPNWNEYINKERSNYHIANKIKQEEKRIVALSCIGKKYQGKYPVEIIFKKHFKDHRQDLDNVRVKGLLDGLVSSGVLKNDNLKHIQKITLEPIFDDIEGIEIEIKEICKNEINSM